MVNDIGQDVADRMADEIRRQGAPSS